MNEQLQQKLLQYLNGLESLADKSGDFLGDQIPQIAVEIVRFGAAQHIIWVIVTMTIVALSEIARRRITRILLVDDTQYGHESLIPLNIITGILMIVFAVAMVHEMIDAMEAIVAPRLFLLEYVKTLIK